MATTGPRILKPRRLDDLPPVAEFEAIPCPVDRFAALTRHARSRGTLPQSHARVRRAALAQALLAGYTAYAVARRAAVHPSRGYQLKARAAS